jgi:acyl-CoA dehydrogenase
LPAFRDLVADVATAPDSRSLWRGLGESGVLRQVTAGSEVDGELLGVLLAELDGRAPMDHVLSVCVQVATVIPLLRVLACGEAAHTVEAVLDEVSHGKAMVALAVTDADLAGSALMSLRTTVLATRDGPVLRGGKEWITNALDADHVLVLARHRPAHHVTSLRWVLVPTDQPGLSRTPSGTTFPSVGHLVFDDVRLAEEHLVGRPGRALAEFARHVGTERLAGALWARALCRRVLARTYAYLTTRSTGGAVLWDLAAVRERFAWCVVEWRRLAALCEPPRSIAAGMVLKAACAGSVDRILGECVHLQGAAAFQDGGVAGIRERAAMFGIAGGATGAMLAGIADHVDELLGST